MRSLFLTIFIAAGLFALTNISSSKATNMTKGEVEAIVKQYLLENPEVVIDALEAYRDKQDRIAQEKVEKGIRENQDALFNNPLAPSVGPVDADVVVAQFFDYHCGYCKRMLPVITKLLEDDKKVRIVFHELPILSQDSRLAAKAALAVSQIQPNQYFAFHSKLMNTSGKFSKEMLIKEAVALGVDEKKFTDALENEALDNALKSSKALAGKLGISGTPAMVVNKELIPGASSLEALKEVIAEQRKAVSE